jgi:hypothetical protein
MSHHASIVEVVLVCAYGGIPSFASLQAVSITSYKQKVLSLEVQTPFTVFALPSLGWLLRCCVSTMATVISVERKSADKPHSCEITVLGPRREEAKELMKKPKKRAQSRLAAKGAGVRRRMTR